MQFFSIDPIACCTLITCESNDISIQHSETLFHPPANIVVEYLARKGLQLEDDLLFFCDIRSSDHDIFPLFPIPPFDTKSLLTKYIWKTSRKELLDTLLSTNSLLTSQTLSRSKSDVKYIIDRSTHPNRLMMPIRLQDSRHL